MLEILLVPLVFLAIFMAAFLGVAGAWVFLQRRAAAPGNGVAGPVASGEDDPPRLLMSDHLSTISVWDALLGWFDFMPALRARIAEADLRWSVGRLTALMLLCGTTVLAILLKLNWLPWIAAVAPAVLAAFLPYFYMMGRRGRRFRQIEEQLPDALDFLARALRAGHPFAVSLEMLAAEGTPPLSIEIRKICDERQFGMRMEEALANLGRRVPLLDVGFFVAAVQVQSRTGGKLGEVLERLAETVRERFALKGEIRSIAAHGKLTGTILTILPLIVVAVTSSVNPGYFRILLDNPGGRWLIFSAGVCLVLAHFVIRMIVNIKV